MTLICSPFNRDLALSETFLYSMVDPFATIDPVCNHLRVLSCSWKAKRRLPNKYHSTFQAFLLPLTPVQPIILEYIALPSFPFCMSCMFKHAVNALPIEVCMWMYFLLKFKYMDIYEKISYQFSPKILFID